MISEKITVLLPKSKWYCINPNWSGYKKVFVFEYEKKGILIGNMFFLSGSLIGSWSISGIEVLEHNFCQIKEGKTTSCSSCRRKRK